MNRSNSYRRLGIRMAFAMMLVSLCVGNAGCGSVRGTDGQTLTTIGLTHLTSGQTQTEIGVGGGMDRSMGHYRPNTFGGRTSPAMSNLFNNN